MREGSLSGRAVATGPRPDWKDGNRYVWALGAVVPLFLFVGWGLVNLTGLSLFWWFGPIMLFLIVPPLDLLVGTDRTNPPDEMVPWLEKDMWYRWITYAYLPFEYAALFAGFWLITQREGLTVVDKIGIALTLGTMTGIAINTAHELGHKKDHVERWLAKVALAPTCYGHFYIEHNRGHHVKVATYEDAASARFGENLWTFIPRSAVGGARSSLHLEANRLRRMGKPNLSLHNDVLNAWLMTPVLMAILVAAFGPEILPYFLLQAAFGGLLLFETVNYLEHYGLARQKLPNGRWERITPEHSWNSNNRVTNVLLYHLQRHSDHHANPTRRYQQLRHFEESPQLPSGYAAMILLAYCPPLWRKVMDHRVLEHYNGDITKAHVLPRKREKILAKYGVRTAVSARGYNAPSSAA